MNTHFEIQVMIYTLLSNLLHFYFSKCESFDIIRSDYNQIRKLMGYYPEVLIQRKTTNAVKD